MNGIKAFKLDIPKSEIEDLKKRLGNARWPESETVDDWSQGVPIKYHREFCDYWANHYDWYATQDRLNQFAQYTTNLDGLNFHFIHVKSSHANARPLILTHGWPGSVVEFLKIIEPLAEPTKHGGNDEDACHVICPSLPGFGFSDKPSSTGWRVPRIAAAWDELMTRLGYDNYYAQGGDWASAVTTAMGTQNKGRCKSIHVNMPIARAPKEALENPTEADKRALARAKKLQNWGTGIPNSKALALKP